MSDLLPANAADAERALSLAVERHAALPVPVRDVWNAATCPADLLAWLAWAYSVDEWDTVWSAEQKRQTIRASIDVHRHKGTIGAVKEALAALGIDAQVQEWFNQIPEGTPYTFKVLLTAEQIGISQQSIVSVFNSIERTKNLRSHLDSVQVVAKSQAGPFVAACASLGSEIHVSRYVRYDQGLSLDAQFTYWPLYTGPLVLFAPAEALDLRFDTRAYQAWEPQDNGETLALSFSTQTYSSWQPNADGVPGIYKYWD